LNLIDAYCDYYSTPQLATAQNLALAIDSYEFNNYEELNNILWDLCPKITRLQALKINHQVLISSGSTSMEQRNYVFAPMPNFWFVKIETLIKNQKTQPIIFLKSNFAPLEHQYMNVSFQIETTSLFYAKNADIITFDASETQCIQSYCQERKDWLVVAHPSIFLYLFKDHNFFITNSCVSVDWEPFYPTHPVNDNMVDWTSGCNFWTCPNGTKHFLPIFAIQEGKIKNLLNFASPIEQCSDLFQINNKPTFCSCGRTYLPFNFIPHVNTAIRKPDNTILYDPFLANQLTSQYRNFQIIQKQNKINILYITHDHGPTQDKELITKYLSNHGFENLEFFQNSYFITGGAHKLATFYKDIFQKPIMKVQLPPKLHM
jgi:hypothetical protein